MSDIRPADPQAPDMAPLLRAHLEHSWTATPQTSNHTMDAQALAEPGIAFFALYENGEVLACGALKSLDDGTAEVKSVHVVERARGRGLARRIMAHLDAVARDRGHSALVLETGADHLPEYAAARALYERLGYEYCSPIPGYGPDPNSAFMRLDL
ncbi:GNAT family N-acetyltransferase [Lutimaribacter marinistellae]|uniref:GNAT family N-acetyltransferase n=1 Tax=Lutimaribacter marinistellae TaxID=1820329 RepID=A0ABV7THV9_9RHOB